MKALNSNLSRLVLFSEPLKSIRDNKLHFTAWLIVVITFGMAGFWVRLIVLAVKHPVPFTLQNIVTAATFAPFVIVILVDGIGSMLGAVKGGSNVVAAGIRVIVGLVALIVVFVQVVVFSIVEADAVGQQIIGSTPAGFQIVLTIAAVLIASYLYCFKFREWEKDVANWTQRENKDIDEMKRRADLQSRDYKGIKL